MKSSSAPSRKASLGIGLVAGAVIGFSAAKALRSKTAKATLRDLEAVKNDLQKQVLRELKDVKRLSQSVYNEAVEHAVDTYAKGKKLAAQDRTLLQKLLRQGWKQLKERIDKRLSA